MSDIWYPGAEIDHQEHRQWSLLGGPPRVTVHTLEGYSHVGGRDDYHLTIGWEGDSTAPGTGPMHVTQWRPADVACGALARETSVQTNRRGSRHFQICLAWEAERMGSFPLEGYEALAEVIGWCIDNHGVAAYTRMPRGLGVEAYGANGPARMTEAEWEQFNGICGHQEVPTNRHWDCGIIDWALLLEIIAEDDESEGGEPEPAPPNTGDVIATRINSTQGISFSAWWHRPIWIGQVEPTNPPITGALWLNNATGQWLGWNGSAWVPMTDL